jgi:hypothetical protein
VPTAEAEGAVLDEWGELYDGGRMLSSCSSPSSATRTTTRCGHDASSKRISLARPVTSPWRTGTRQSSSKQTIVRDLGERSFLELDGTGIADAENLGAI